MELFVVAAEILAASFIAIICFWAIMIRWGDTSDLDQNSFFVKVFSKRPKPSTDVATDSKLIADNLRKMQRELAKSIELRQEIKQLEDLLESRKSSRLWAEIQAPRSIKLSAVRLMPKGKERPEEEAAYGYAVEDDDYTYKEIDELTSIGKMGSSSIQ